MIFTEVSIVFKIKDMIYYEDEYLGMDSPDKCPDKKHFFGYKKTVSYKYNSKGFRDEEWPDDLSDVLWCVGDSFTVGMGQPYEEIWPRLLERKTGKRCLNIGVSGTSNDSIAIRVKQIAEKYPQENILVMWSYLHRRRSKKGTELHYNKDNDYIDDVKNFAENFKRIDSIYPNIIHSVIPWAIVEIKKWNGNAFKYFIKKFGGFTKKECDKIIAYEQLDWSRDFNHFDLRTSEQVTKMLIPKIKTLDQKH